MTDFKLRDDTYVNVGQIYEATLQNLSMCIKVLGLNSFTEDMTIGYGTNYEQHVNWKWFIFNAGHYGGSLKLKNVLTPNKSGIIEKRHTLKIADVYKTLDKYTDDDICEDYFL